MKIVNIVDIHGNDSVIEKVGDILSSADLVLIGGDITHFGGREEASLILDKIKAYNKNIFAVTGNCDKKEVDEYLDGEEINIHGRSMDKNGVSFIGAGGSLPCPSPTPNIYEEDEYPDILSGAMGSGASEKPVVMVCHQPPYGTINDTLPGGDHVGSRSVREFIESTQPLVCFTGHIHEAPGIDEIGKTKIVNPGPLGTGRYALLELSDKIESLEIMKF